MHNLNATEVDLTTEDLSADELQFHKMEEPPTETDDENEEDGYEEEPPLSRPTTSLCSVFKKAFGGLPTLNHYDWQRRGTALA